jgi:hypothetical protein
MSLVEPPGKLAAGEPQPEAGDAVDKPPWWDGRQVAIRPDVPGREFDPGDMVLIKTDDEWDQIEPQIDAYVAEVKKTPTVELWPEWMPSE